MRDTLAVVGAVDIHLAAAIGAIEQACERCGLTPAVRVASDLAADFLHKVKGLLVNDGFMGILKNRPFVLRDIMTFLVLDFVLVLLLRSAGFPIQVVLMKPVLAFLTLADFL